MPLCAFDLIVSDAEQLFTCLFAISMFSFEKMSESSNLFFLGGVLFFLILIYMSCLYILEINPLWLHQ